jgi:hypothetical protein
VPYAAHKDELYAQRMAAREAAKKSAEAGARRQRKLLAKLGVCDWRAVLEATWIFYVVVALIISVAPLPWFIAKQRTWI